ncbi:amidoligase family protein [Celeribacter indicus]|uniref:Amidoligase enzyme n=1 Tax=Celeribacter indicus TaxID=1208324 RepID=A0A0B5DNM4_9RHOB|nr:amidoligase family protein [Celeribacter indicus]AJE45153.1 hypothetical protein P73_0438 [Celeribacter indicus]SDX26273.1 Putative amidoligase enzyme [Celeribacter indicus]
MTFARTDSFLPLPTLLTVAGTPRRTGVEIEFGGLPESAAARIVRDLFGGKIAAKGSHGFVVEGGEIGKVEVYLDTALRKKSDSRISELGLDLSRAVVPVEVVTAPLDDLSPLTRVIQALREAGAEGSGDGVFYGFGVHFNPEVVALDAEHVVPIAKAYALTENFLRAVWPIDAARNLLPFTDDYPKAYLDAIAGRAFPTLGDFMRTYLDTTPSRNRGLDLLPLLRAHDEAAFTRLAPGMRSVSARPAFHFRLPDCRIDEPGWSLAQEWRRWIFVERVAADPARLAALEADWCDYSRTLFATRSDWIDRSRAHVADLAQEVLGRV